MQTLVSAGIFFRKVGLGLRVRKVPSDWVYFSMTGPDGLLIIGMAASLSAFLWMIVLGEASTRIGFSPLIAGYACGGLGLLFCNFLISYHEFNNRVLDGGLQESHRWTIVPSWTLYLSAISLIYALPLATIVGVPVTALLLRIGKLTCASIAATAVVVWLCIVIFFWSFPTNDWHRSNRVASLTKFLMDFAPIVALMTVPFQLGIYAVSRSRRRLAD